MNPWRSCVELWRDSLLSSSFRLETLCVNSQVLIRRPQQTFYRSAVVVAIGENSSSSIASASVSNVEVRVDEDSSSIYVPLIDLLPFRRIDNESACKSLLSVGKSVLMLANGAKGRFLSVRIERIEYPDTPGEGNSSRGAALWCSDGRESFKLLVGSSDQILEQTDPMAFCPSSVIRAVQDMVDGPELGLAELNDEAEALGNSLAAVLSHVTHGEVSAASSSKSQRQLDCIHSVRVVSDCAGLVSLFLSLVRSIMARPPPADAVKQFGSPVKRRDDLSAIGAVLARLLPLLAQAGEGLAQTLVGRLQVPFEVNSRLWVAGLATCHRLLSDLAYLAESVRKCDLELSVAAEPITAALSVLEAKVGEASDLGVMSVSCFLNGVLLDSVSRQEWLSHSAFLRDKRVSHGAVALTTTVRALLHDLAHLCGAPQPFDSGVQLLLAALSIAARTYLLVATSRVRLFQWRVDLSHVVLSCLEAFAWWARVHSVPSDEQDEAVGEVLRLLRYVLLVLHLVCAPCEDSSLATTLRTVKASDQSGASGPSGPAGASIAHLVDLMRCTTTVGDWTESMFRSEEEPAQCQPRSSGSQQKGPCFDVTADVTAWAGLLPSAAAEVWPLLSSEEMLLFEKEQKTKPANGLVGFRGVVFHRVVSFAVVDAAPLLEAVLADREDFLRLHGQLSLSPLQTGSLVTSFVVPLLQRRFEVMQCEYPVLTPTQIEHADSIRQEFGL